MKRNYNITYRLIAFVLLLSLCLQSCDSSFNQLTPKVETFSRHTVQQSTHLINIDLLKDQELTAEKGYLVNFYEKNGYLLANVRVDESQKEPNYRNLPVIIEEGTDLAQLPHLTRETQQLHIQLEYTQNGKPSRVIVSKGCILGGMMEGEDDPKTKSTEKDKDGEKTSKANSSSHQNLLESAIQGDAEAQFRLGQKAYRNWQQKYTEEASHEARVWLGKAAIQRHEGAIDLLAEMNSVMRPGIKLKKGDREKEEDIELAIACSSRERAIWTKFGFKTSLSSIPKEGIKYIKELGSGGSGVVYQATYQGNTVAVKRLQSFSQQQIAALNKEAIVMANNTHNNIITFIGFCPEGHALIMEYMPGGSLASLLKSSKDIPWQLRYQIALDVGGGMSYLHEHDIVHCDLKSENILLDDNRRAKVTDFGTAAFKSDNSTYGLWTSGTYRWMAPERIKTEDINNKAGDVYSYGMVLWQLGARRDPFETITNLFQLANHIVAGNREVISEDTPLEIKSLIELCWLPELYRPEMKTVQNVIKGYCAVLERGTLVSRLKQVEEEKDKLIEQLKEKENFIDQSGKKLEQVQNDKEALKQELVEKEEAYKKLQEECRRNQEASVILKKELEEKENACKKLEEELETSQVAFSKLRKEKETLLIEKEGLISRLERLEKDKASKNLKTSFGAGCGELIYSGNVAVGTITCGDSVGHGRGICLNCYKIGNVMGCKRVIYKNDDLIIPLKHCGDTYGEGRCYCLNHLLEVSHDVSLEKVYQQKNSSLKRKNKQKEKEKESAEKKEEGKEKALEIPQPSPHEQVHAPRIRIPEATVQRPFIPPHSNGLHGAAHSGNSNKVLELINSGADVNAIDCNGWTPLHYAADKTYTAVAKLLIEKGANVNTTTDNDGNTPLHHAIHMGGGRKDILELLIEKGANLEAIGKYNTPLGLAAQIGLREVVELLIEKGAQINGTDNLGRTPLHTAIAGNHIDIAELLIENGANVNATDKHGSTPLHYCPNLLRSGRVNVAVRNNEDKDKVELLIIKLIDKGTQVNATNNVGRTPLHHAVSKGRKDIVELLITKGAQIDAIALHIAVANDQIDIVELLIGKGADVNATDNQGQTALHNLAKRDNLVVKNNRGKDNATLLMTKLIAKGAQVNATDNQGQTPLHHAVYRAVYLRTARQDIRKDIIELLINKGAQVNATNNKDQTPLQYAMSIAKGPKDIIDILELLRSKGAKVSATDKILLKKLCIQIK